MDTTTQKLYDHITLFIEGMLSELNRQLELEEFYLTDEEFEKSEKVGNILKQRQACNRALKALRIEFGE